MPNAITDYIVEIGGPIAGVSTGMYFLLQHYVTARIKADFAKQLEDIRKTNQTAIEILRATMQKDLESAKSSLEISRTTTRILIEKRIQYYEDFFKISHALQEALTNLRVRVKYISKDPQGQENYNNAHQQYYATHGEYVAWLIRNAAFAPQAIQDAMRQLLTSMDNSADAAKTGEWKESDALCRQRNLDRVAVDKMIRDDLLKIQETSKLDYD